MIDKSKFSQYKKYLKDNLSQKRYKHSLNVANAAVRLAKRNDVDTDRAYAAGLLHDVCKELSGVEQLELIKQTEFEVDQTELRTPSMYHAIAGSVFVRQHFGIDDEEIIRAIRFHTVASDKMSKLEQIVYLADLISADREYDGVEKMRRLCLKSLSRGMLEALSFQIISNTQKGNFLIASTVRAYNEYVLKERFQ